MGWGTTPSVRLFFSKIKLTQATLLRSHFPKTISHFPLLNFELTLSPSVRSHISDFISPQLCQFKF